MPLRLQNTGIRMRWLTAINRPGHSALEVLFKELRVVFSVRALSTDANLRLLSDVYRAMIGVFTQPERHALLNVVRAMLI